MRVCLLSGLIYIRVCCIAWSMYAYASYSPAHTRMPRVFPDLLGRWIYTSMIYTSIANACPHLSGMPCAYPNPQAYPPHHLTHLPHPASPFSTSPRWHLIFYSEQRPLHRPMSTFSSTTPRACGSSSASASRAKSFPTFAACASSVTLASPPHR